MKKGTIEFEKGSPSGISQSPLRIPGLDWARALAAFFVMWNHFTHHGVTFASPGAQAIFMSPAILKNRMVFIFFFISGFLYTSTFIRNQGGQNMSFFRRRFTRIYLPYLAVVFLAPLLLWGFYLLPFGNVPRPSFSFLDFIGNAFLFEEFLDDPYWLSPVLWNIPIQVQFIVIIALAYFLLKTHPHVASFFLIIVAVAALLSSSDEKPIAILRHFPFFSVGIGLSMLVSGQKKALPLALLLLSLVTIFISFNLSTVVIFTLVSSLAFIRLPPPRFITFLAGISYSLYLTHSMTGSRFCNLMKRVQIEGDLFQATILVLAIAISIFCAWVFYRLVERPSHQLSRKV